MSVAKFMTPSDDTKASEIDVTLYRRKTGLKTELRCNREVRNGRKL